MQQSDMDIKTKTTSDSKLLDTKDSTVNTVVDKTCNKMDDSPPPKKMKVNIDDPNTEFDDQRLVNTDLDKRQRDNVLRWIIACHIQLTSRITRTIDYKNEIFRNVNLSQRMTRILSTLHSCLCQEELGSGSLRTTMKDKSYSLYVAGESKGSMKHTDCLKIVKNLANSFDLSYTKPKMEDTNHWFGTAALLLSFINMFKFRLNELRVGHSSFRIQKTATVNKTISVSQYGLYVIHHVLLEGITIPPKEKNVMAQYLGPLTSLICLSRSKKDLIYSQNWRSAVKKALAFIPEIDSIIEVCCEKPATEVRVLFRILGDIILMTTSSEPHFASFPACMMYLLLEESEILHYLGNSTIFTKPTDIAWFNFSGNGAAQLYKMAEAVDWKSSIQATATSFLPEIIFHSIWGTYATDFGLLEFMTDHKCWSNRYKMNDAFNRMGSHPVQTVKLIKLEKFAELCSAKQTEMLSLSSSPIVKEPTFSGKIFTDELLDCCSTKSVKSGVIKNIEKLCNLLMQVKEGLITELRENRMQKRGTTNWHTMVGSTKTAYGEEISDVPCTNGLLF